MTDEPVVRIMVHPEPTPDEEAAILAVLLLIRGEEGSHDGVDAQPVSRWAKAGRLQAHQRLSNSARIGSTTRNWKERR